MELYITLQIALINQSPIYFCNLYPKDFPVNGKYFTKNFSKKAKNFLLKFLDFLVNS
jgi:hypothetical protein